MADSAPARRRFQFRLRTLMIGVTLLAVPCAYVGWQAKIVRHRRDLLKGLRDRSIRYELTTNYPQLTDPPRIPLIREWLGDSAVWAIGYRPNSSPPNLDELRIYFPEAIIGPFSQRSPEPLQPSAGNDTSKRDNLRRTARPATKP